MAKYLSFRESLEVPHSRGTLVYKPSAVLVPVTSLKNGRFVTESEFQVINYDERDKGLSVFDFSLSTVAALGNDPSKAQVVRLNHPGLELEKIISNELGNIDLNSVYEQVIDNDSEPASVSQNPVEPQN